MANGSHVSSPEAFDTKEDPSQVSVRWQRWKRGFEYYLAARGNTEDEQKRALLLHCAGLNVQPTLHSFLAITGKFSAMIGTLLYVFGSSESPS